MRALTNPYTPNAGAIVGRDDQFASFDLLLARLARGRTEQSMIITGLRGVGKTVLLRQFRTKALEQEWVVVAQEVSKQDEADFRRDISSRLRTTLLQLSPKVRWTDRLRHAAAVLKSFSISIDASGTFTARMDLTDVFLALGEAAKEQERGVVLPFDEVQFLTKNQLEALIQALHKMVQHKLPIILVGAGLPQIAELASDAKSYAERLFKFPGIGNLDPGDAKLALARPAAEGDATYHPDALTEAVAITGGYPYFIQELGYAVWTVAAGPGIALDDIHAAVPAYETTLDASFFRVRLDRTTDLQRAYLRAMAQLGPAPRKPPTSPTS